MSAFEMSERNNYGHYYPRPLSGRIDGRKQPMRRFTDQQLLDFRKKTGAKPRDEYLVRILHMGPDWEQGGSGDTGNDVGLQQGLYTVHVLQNDISRVIEREPYESHPGMGPYTHPFLPDGMWTFYVVTSEHGPNKLDKFGRRVFTIGYGGPTYEMMYDEFRVIDGPLVEQDHKFFSFAPGDQQRGKRKLTLAQWNRPDSP